MFSGSTAGKPTLAERFPRPRSTLVRSRFMLRGCRWIGRLWSVALAALVVTSPAAQGAQPWHVDPSFGIGGIQSLHYGNLGRASLPASFVPGASGLYWVLSLD